MRAGWNCYLGKEMHFHLFHPGKCTLQENSSAKSLVEERSALLTFSNT